MVYKTLYGDLIKILTNVVDNNIYGSVEIFFEKGKVTQITQRIIKKVQHDNGQYDINQKQPLNGTHAID